MKNTKAYFLVLRSLQEISGSCTKASSVATKLSLFSLSTSIT